MFVDLHKHALTTLKGELIPHPTGLQSAPRLLKWLNDRPEASQRFRSMFRQFFDVSVCKLRLLFRFYHNHSEVRAHQPVHSVATPALQFFRSVFIVFCLTILMVHNYFQVTEHLRKTSEMEFSDRVRSTR